MKKQQKKYLALYEKWLKTGKLPKDGLCESLGKGVVRKFTPTGEEFGCPNPELRYWGLRGL